MEAVSIAVPEEHHPEGRAAIARQAVGIAACSGLPNGSPLQCHPRPVRRLRLAARGCGNYRSGLMADGVRRSGLDGLRGAAALAVVAYHSILACDGASVTRVLG